MKKKIVLAISFLFIFCGCNANSDSKEANPAIHTETAADKNQNSDVDPNQAFTEEIFAMDTFMKLTAYGPNAPEALKEAANEIQRLDALWSVNNEQSEIYFLNQNKKSDVSDDTAAILKTSLELYQKTGGCFNIAIFPIVKAWGFTTQNYQIPSDQTIKEILPFTNASLIKLESNHALFENDHIEIDLGGIAKGYTSHKIMQIFKDGGVASGIVSLGGNVQALGAKPDGSDWKVAIQDPSDPNDYMGAVSIQDKAVITSGVYQRYFERDNKIYHHLIDPETGKPADKGLISVTIICANGTMADGFSTSLFVMGLEDAIEYWRSMPEEFDAIFITDDKKIYITENIQNSFSALKDNTTVFVIEKSV